MLPFGASMARFQTSPAPFISRTKLEPWQSNSMWILLHICAPTAYSPAHRACRCFACFGGINRAINSKLQNHWKDAVNAPGVWLHCFGAATFRFHLFHSILCRQSKRAMELNAGIVWWVWTLKQL